MAVKPGRRNQFIEFMQTFVVVGVVAILALLLLKFDIPAGYVVLGSGAVALLVTIIRRRRRVERYR